jgi:class III poly(R)-hydroxyalkanoic acid synthase PhaE subunit
MNNTTDYFESWRKAQEDFTKSWEEGSKKLQQAFLGGGGAASDDYLLNLYNSWTKAIFESISAGKDSHGDITKETLSKVFGSSNAYVKLYEVWFPLFKAIQGKTFNADSFKDLSDPAKYKEVLDKVWGFNPDAMTEFNNQAKKLMEMFGKTSEQFAGPWSEAIQKNLQAAPQLFEGHPESIMNTFHNLFKAFDGTVGTAFHVPAVGKDREKIELVLRWLDDMSVYMAKNTEYQHVMYSTGQAAMERVIQVIAKKIADGGEVKDFNELFNLWIDLNEKTYYALFQTEDFSRLQGAVLDSSLNLRKHFFKLMELHLYDFPIALRSEMDDLYKTVYELKKKVKGLERQIKNGSGREARV